MQATTPLDLQDYLDATSDAGRRSRTVTLIIVIACVVVFAGLLNSLQAHWMRQRVNRFQDINDPYVRSLIGDPPAVLGGQEAGDRERDASRRLYEERYGSTWTALTKALVENSFVIRVPFFGFSFDVNDLGLLGGVAFLVLLAVYRFCLSREVDNLRVGFEEARRLGKLREFYLLLAMRQVFTVPRTPGRSPPRRFLVVVPKLICVLPLVVHLAVVIHDVVTVGIGNLIQARHTLTILLSETLCLAGMIPLTWMAVTRLVRMDHLWEEYWRVLPGVNVTGMAQDEE